VIKATEPLYLDDLHVGQRFTSGNYLMEETRIKEFAAEFDPQPFHLDEAAGEASIFQGLAASGWHTAAATMRLLVTGGLPIATGLVGLGGEVSWPRPTRPGDILHVESEVIRIITLNQRAEAVYTLTAKLLVPRRKTESRGQSE
jgi:acyl dehydratase